MSESSVENNSTGVPLEGEVQAVGDSAGSTELVPFSMFNPYTEMLKLDKRLFRFHNDSISITMDQDWKPGGRGGTNIGFGASVYDCSIVLAYFLSLESISREIKGKTVIELGCGPAFASLAAGYVAEARVVIATDGDSDSVSLANHNININKDANPHRNTSSVLTGHQLYWGNQKHIENVKSLISPVGPYDGVDYIIMSDVVALVYADAFECLLTTLDQLCNDNTVIYLTYQRRHYSENSFFEKLKQCNRYSIKMLIRRYIHEDFRHLPIMLYELHPIRPLATDKIDKVRIRIPLRISEILHAQPNPDNANTFLSTVYKDKSLMPMTPKNSIGVTDENNDSRGTPATSYLQLIPCGTCEVNSPYRPPTIETKRVLLIPPDETDETHITSMLSVYESFNDHDIDIWGGSVAHTKDEMKVKLEQHNMQLEKSEGVRWCIQDKETHAIIGSIGFYKITSHFRGELGYELHKSYWKCGIMSEALSAVMSIGFNLMKMHAIQAQVDPRNNGSRKLLEKFKFMQEGHFKEDFYANNKFYDSVVYCRISDTANENYAE